APLPARRISSGSPEWIRSARIAARHGNRTIARQPMGPVVVTRAQRLFDEQSAEPRAVDEQVARDGLSVGENHRIDIAALSIELHVYDLALDPVRAAGFGVVAEECRIEPRVEMERVAHARQRQLRISPRSRVAAE